MERVQTGRGYKRHPWLGPAVALVAPGPSDLPLRERQQFPGWVTAVRIDQGRRHRVEDAYRVLPSASHQGRAWTAFAIFDGLGGEPFGQEAAWEAAEKLEVAVAGATSPESVLPVLNGYVRQTQGSTTAIVALFPQRSGEGLLMSLGDSSAFALSGNGNVESLTPLDRGPGRAVTACLGPQEVTPQVRSINLPIGGTLVLATDGAEAVSPERLRPLFSSPDVAAAIDDFSQQVLAAGAPDNCTVLAARRLA